MMIGYFDLIKRRYDRGMITYDKYVFLVDKLTQWYHLYSELEDDKMSAGEICEKCNGYGYVRFRNGGDEECSECDGEGMTHEEGE